jgi:LysR family hydrogen peroxide-inducible transcriptional activator
MLSSQQIQYILALSETQHFSRAADSCFVTQPTLSMQIKKAEELLGFPIFDRNRTPIELTSAGKELVPILREISADFQQIDKLKKQKQGNYLEEIKIGIIPTISAYLIPVLYTKWQKEFPSIKLIIEEQKSEDIIESLHQKKIDLGIMAGPIDELSFKSIPLFAEEIKAYIPQIDSEEVSLDTLRNLHPWLLNKGNCLRTQMIHFCEIRNENTEQKHWNYEGGNLEMMIRMVDLNRGYTLVPDFYSQIIPEKTIHFKTIVSTLQQKPARSIIGIVPHKNSKWKSIEQLIRSIQLNFNENNDRNLLILDWK